MCQECSRGSDEGVEGDEKKVEENEEESIYEEDEGIQ